MLQDTEQRFAPDVPGRRDHLVGASGPIYRFEEIEIDSTQAYLKRAGQDQYIRQQAFHVLLYLIERRHSLVTKEELVARFWHDTAVTDNAVVQCVADIRKALGDDSRNPRFIKTVPKVGYRFIGEVRVQPEAQPEALANEPRITKRALPRPGGARTLPWTSFAITALTVILVTASYVLLRHSADGRMEILLPASPEKKAIAVMYFENQSQRADLSWLREGLADMFITDLAHSDRVAVLSREQLELLLGKAGHNPAADIRLDEALAVARRSRAENVLLGSFAQLGERLVINVRLFDSARGRLLEAEEFNVSRPAEILAQVDLLSPKLLSRLGIGSSDASRNSALAETMTHDFEAYRYYSLGVGKAKSFENAEAVSLLHKAVQRDPNFAMAYARIGYAYSVTDFMPEKGRPYLEKAFQLSNRLSEKDRLYVAAWYAIACEDYASAIETLRQIVLRFPLEIEAYARLARLLLREERPQQAISFVQQGLAIDPEADDLYNVLGICFLGLRRYDEAIAAHERYVQLSPKDPNAHDSLGMSYQQSGRYSDAMNEYLSALALNSSFEPSIIHLGDVYAQQGRYRDAIREYRHYIQITRSDAARAVAYGSIALVCRNKRDLRGAEQAAENETRYNAGAVWNSLLLALDRGDNATARRLKHGLFENLPYPERGVRHEMRSYDYYLGTLALRNNQSDEAISRFTQALSHLPPSSGLDLYEDCLGNAYLALGQVDRAIAEYQRIARLNPAYPLLEYHLAQAYQRKGQMAEARSAYQRFLHTWQGADADIPELQEAQSKLGERSHGYSE
jgi:tetratricopeptide (TPR) repeat protein/DNA-binding winged helix-turn-helix (wHTH) protein